MTETLTLKSLADVARAVPPIFGFVPSDSLVVVPIGSGPFGRVDLTSMDDILGLASGLASAVDGYWSKSPVIVMTYGSLTLGENAFTLRRTFLPGVRVLDWGHVVDGSTVQSLMTGSVEPITNIPTGTILDAKAVASSRDALEADALTVSDPQTAETLAVESYMAGNGARAWCFLDRAEELSGTRSALMRRLAYNLENAVSPF